METFLIFITITVGVTLLSILRDIGNPFEQKKLPEGSIQLKLLHVGNQAYSILPTSFLKVQKYPKEVKYVLLGIGGTPDLWLTDKEPGKYWVHRATDHMFIPIEFKESEDVPGMLERTY